MFDFFSEPAEPFFLFSYPDILILVILNVLFYFVYLKNKIKFDLLQKICWFLLFGIAIPKISITIEVNNVYNKNTIVDGFNLWYCFLKIPVWWFVGFLNYFIIKKIVKGLKK